MTQAHRQWHLWLWLVLSLAVIGGLAMSMIYRPASHADQAGDGLVGSPPGSTSMPAPTGEDKP